MPVARLYIIDEHESVRRALAERLAKSTEVQLAGHAGDAQTALRELTATPVDIVLVEIKRSDGMGLEMVRQLAGASPIPLGCSF